MRRDLPVLAGRTIGPPRSPLASRSSENAVLIAAWASVRVRPRSATTTAGRSHSEPESLWSSSRSCQIAIQVAAARGSLGNQLTTNSQTVAIGRGRSDRPHERTPILARVITSNTKATTTDTRPLHQAPEAPAPPRCLLTAAGARPPFFADKRRSPKASRVSLARTRPRS